MTPKEISVDNFLALGRTYYWFLDFIDPWSGSVSETTVPGGEVGQTNLAILGDTFQRLKFGDRFFFSHKLEGSVQSLLPKTR